jgi:hypothetical protein
VVERALAERFGVLRLTFGEIGVELGNHRELKSGGKWSCGLFLLSSFPNSGGGASSWG